jgi:hypothetical protein
MALSNGVKVWKHTQPPFQCNVEVNARFEETSKEILKDVREDRRIR